MPGTSRSDLRRVARSRLQEAQILFDAGRYDAAVYLCGYAVELALKARICMALGWKEYPTPKEKYGSFYVHDLDVLLHLSGRESAILAKTRRKYWDEVSKWNPELRYDAVGVVTAAKAENMITASRELLRLI